MEAMPATPTFRPYVGRNYCNSKQKLLFVGLSHYAGNDEDVQEMNRQLEKGNHSRFTIEMITNWQKGQKKNLKFFTALAKIFTGENYIYKNRSSYLNDIAFFNFHQKFTKRKIGKLNEEELNIDRSNFSIMVSILNPTAIIICGKTALWSYIKNLMESKGEFFSKLQEINMKFDCGIYKYNNNISEIRVNEDNYIPVIAIEHLSRADGAYLRSYIDEFLKQHGQSLPVVS